MKINSTGTTRLFLKLGVILFVFGTVNTSVADSSSGNNNCETFARNGDALYETGDFAGAGEMYQLCIDAYDLHEEGSAEYAAKSTFMMGEITRLDYDTLAVSAENVQQKALLKGYVEEWYGKSLTYNVDVWFIASCVRAGELYENFGNAVYSMEMPASIPEEAIDEFYTQLREQFYEPEIQKAIDIYVTAVKKAASADINNEWVDTAVENLERLAPGEGE
ncbi:MAG: hypothetical protein KAH31_10045 [Candidatus Sabulitectum sp.]|nr:hypothetical protein [Candidatus Sabulitectum sp.]